ncbi:MAG TPA: ABC transporter permease [Verrucomicrobiae bacterium]
MNATRTLAIAVRQFYLLRGSPIRILPLFIWVAIDILLWGFITKYLNSMAAQGTNFVPILLGAVLLWDFFSRVMHGIATSFFEDVWSRNFLNMFASPLKISEYLGGLVVTSIITSMVGLLVMLALATIGFGLPIFAYGTAAIPFLLVLFLFGVALGIAGTALVLRFGPAAEWFVWPIPAMISPFAGVFYPISTLPAWMQWLAYALPPSYVFEALRGIVEGKPLNGAYLAISSALAVFYVFACGWYFRSVYRRAVRTGLLARYSAESAS